MEKTEKFFIFSWKEITVILLLFLVTLGFFFTLGLHYGKKLNTLTPAAEEAAKLEASPETLPSKETIEKSSQNATQAAEDAVKSVTEAEVKNSGIKIDTPKPVDLPSEKTVGPVETTAPTEATAEGTHFAVQLGSYPNKDDAQSKIKVLVRRGLRPEIRTAVVNGQTRFRVVLLGFKTRSLADQKGKELRTKRKIENYVVIRAD